MKNFKKILTILFLTLSISSIILGKFKYANHKMLKRKIINDTYNELLIFKNDLYANTITSCSIKIIFN